MLVPLSMRGAGGVLLVERWKEKGERSEKAGSRESEAGSNG